MEPIFVIAASGFVVTFVLGVWRINASHNKRTDQLRRDMRADMERVEANRRADMERMEANRRADMERMEANRRADMKRMEANIDEFRNEVFARFKELTESVAKLDSRVSYIEGILDRRFSREVPPLDLPASPI